MKTADKQMLIRIPRALRTAANRQARKQGKTTTAWLLDLIEAHVNVTPLRPVVKPRQAVGQCTRCRCRAQYMVPQCLCYCHQEM